MKCRSLSVERHAVGALLGSGIGFVGTYHDLIQRAVVLCAAMVLTLVDGTLDAVVSTARMVHGCFLLRSMVRSYRSKSLGTCVQYFLIGENIFAEKIDTYINIGYNMKFVMYPILWFTPARLGKLVSRKGHSTHPALKVIDLLYTRHTRRCGSK